MNFGNIYAIRLKEGILDRRKQQHNHPPSVLYKTFLEQEVGVGSDHLQSNVSTLFLTDSPANIGTKLINQKLISLYFLGQDVTFQVQDYYTL